MKLATDVRSISSIRREIELYHKKKFKFNQFVITCMYNLDWHLFIIIYSLHAEAQKDLNEM